MTGQPEIGDNPDHLIDTHAHLDAAGGIPGLAVDTTATSTSVIAVTNLPRHYRRLVNTVHPRVCWALGLHPAQPHPKSTLEEFLELLPTCDAIGEIGLDGSTTGPQAVPLSRQRDELAQILAHPEVASRMITMHSRRATKQVIEHLKDANLPGVILHWFTGTPTQAAKAAETGAYFSINTRMARQSDLLDALPRGRVLLETDAPYAAKAGRPGDLRPVVQVLAQQWSIDTIAVEETVVANQQQLFATLGVVPFNPTL